MKPSAIYLSEDGVDGWLMPKQYPLLTSTGANLRRLCSGKIVPLCHISLIEHKLCTMRIAIVRELHYRNTYMSFLCCFMDRVVSPFVLVPKVTLLLFQ